MWKDHYIANAEARTVSTKGQKGVKKKSGVCVMKVKTLKVSPKKEGHQERLHEDYMLDAANGAKWARS